MLLTRLLLNKLGLWTGHALALQHDTIDVDSLLSPDICFNAFHDVLGGIGPVVLLLLNGLHVVEGFSFGLLTDQSVVWELFVDEVLRHLLGFHVQRDVAIAVDVGLFLLHHPLVLLFDELCLLYVVADDPLEVLLDLVNRLRLLLRLAELLQEACLLTQLSLNWHKVTRSSSVHSKLS